MLFFFGAALKAAAGVFGGGRDSTTKAEAAAGAQTGLGAVGVCGFLGSLCCFFRLLGVVHEPLEAAAGTVFGTGTDTDTLAAGVSCNNGTEGPCALGRDENNVPETSPSTGGSDKSGSSSAKWNDFLRGAPEES